MRSPSWTRRWASGCAAFHLSTNSPMLTPVMVKTSPAAGPMPMPNFSPACRRNGTSTTAAKDAKSSSSVTALFLRPQQQQHRRIKKMSNQRAQIAAPKTMTFSSVSILLSSLCAHKTDLPMSGETSANCFFSFRIVVVAKLSGGSSPGLAGGGNGGNDPSTGFDGRCVPATTCRNQPCIAMLLPCAKCGGARTTMGEGCHAKAKCA
mmetsp:Transcript_75678/g.219765  ORF Transcript_75678/g.219765 Transcript_75678/m.219765 type:complete len:206 (+) Transcript_75678:519-1136(+)